MSRKNLKKYESKRESKLSRVITTFRDERTAAWRVRKILAAIQMRHLNILGVYLQNCRFDMESRRKTSRLEMATKKFV